MRTLSLTAASIIFVCQLLTSSSIAQAAADPTNLFSNGDFEEAGTQPPGWKIDVNAGESCSLSSNALTGQRALRFALPVAGNVTAVSEPCAVTAGEDYLFTYWYRADGLTGKGLVRFYTTLVWQDTAGKDIGSEFFEMPYAAVPDYRVFSTTVPAPPSAARALLKFVALVGNDYAGQPCAFYVDQVRLMRLSAPVIPPNALKWPYLGRMPSDSLRLVADKDAAQGEALRAAVGSSGTLTFGPYSTEQPVGDYVVNFRLKVMDNTSNGPVAFLDVSAPGNLAYMLARKTVLATDFKAPGVYQDFPLRFVRPEEGMLEFRVSYAGTADLYYDTKTVLQLAAYPTDNEQAAIWLGGDAAVPSRDAPRPAAAATCSVLVVAGMDNRILFPSEALTLTKPMKCTYAYLATIQSGIVLDQPFPKNPEALNGINLVVLANVPAGALNGLMGRRTLRRFVERGGSLLVFGGPLSLGKGEFAGSALEPMLPVATTGGWDLVKARSPAARPTRAARPITTDLNWQSKPCFAYYQKTVVKPGAEVLLECDGFPALVTGQYGQGRVAVFAGTHLGEASKGTVLFHEWADYPKLLSRVIEWLLSN